MAKFNYYLRDNKSETETPIYLLVRWNGLRLKFPTNETVLPNNWDSENQSIIESKKHPDYSEQNRKLENDYTTAKNEFKRFENDNKRVPNPKELKLILEIAMERKTIVETNFNLLQYIDKFIEESKTRTNDKTGKPIAESTRHTYGQVKYWITEYSKKLKKTLGFEDIDLDFYYDFNKFLVNNGLATNTIGKRIAILKTILRDATDRGINKNTAYQSKRFKVTREQTENIYLNESELNAIYKLDLSKNKKLDNVRDLFLIGCWTGLRFSDFSRLTKENIKGNFIEIETQKTRETVSIPLHHIVKSILRKHKGVLPKAVSNQKTNEYLKELGALVDTLKETASKKMTKGGIEVSKTYQKYELLTTHTARRSFASNLFADGIPSQTIMKITGHKTEKSFMQYIKITSQENANIVRMHWEKKSKLQVI